MSHLVLKEITKRFGRVTAVDRLSLSIGKGECFSMLGQHMTFHAGQVADARRTLGKPPVFG